MAEKKKKKSDTPRHKRLNRQSRIQAAKHWIPKYEGKNLLLGYSRHFAVDKLCAVYELELLGYTFKETYKKALKDSEIQKQLSTEKRKTDRKKQLENDLFSDSDEAFAFIAGYTDGGVPYGITWEECKEDNTRNELFTTKNIDNQERKSMKFDIDNEDLPF